MSLKDVLKMEPEHILKARQIANSIYKSHRPDEHIEMLNEIKQTLIKNTELSRTELLSV